MKVTLQLVLSLTVTVVLVASCGEDDDDSGMGPPTPRGTIRVPTDQPTIQGALNAASSGDTILVAPATYTGVGNRNLDFSGKAILLISEAGPDSTVISAEGQGRVFVFSRNEGASSIIDGFTITAGFTSAGDGGGIFLDGASPTVRNCVLSNNIAQRGGGLAVLGVASPIIEATTLTGNSASDFAGGLYVESASPTISRCTFSGNTSGGQAGGLGSVNAAPALSSSTFSDNVADTEGGGVLLSGGTNLSVARCVFESNSGESGAGIFVTGAATATIEDGFFDGNDDNAVYCGDGSMVTILRVGFVGDRSDTTAAVHCSNAAVALRNVTIWGASGGGAAGVGVENGTATIDNTIVSECGSGVPVTCDASSSVTVSCSDFFDNVDGNFVGCVADQEGVAGNFSADPKLCNPLGDDLGLMPDSPCAPSQSGGCNLIGSAPVGCN